MFRRMIFYPVFIPSGGGGGPKDTLTTFVALGIVITGCTIFVNKLYGPDIKMKVTQGNKYSTDINIREHNFPNIRNITSKNTDCLKKKGYYILENDNMYIYYGRTWKRIARIDIPSKMTSLSQEKLIGDCKECDVHTDVIYKYDDIFGNEKQAKKRLYWHKCFVDELK